MISKLETKNKSVYKSYPYIAYSEKYGIYVLFSCPRCGLVVHDDGSNLDSQGIRIGEYSDAWCEEEYFKYTTDKINISNE